MNFSPGAKSTKLINAVARKRQSWTGDGERLPGVISAMAVTEQDPGAQTRVFDLRPNAGVYWRQTVIIFAIFAVVCMSVALAFTAAGFWPILPFAGAEIIALGTALYVSARPGRYREVIRVEPAWLRVEKGYRQPEQIWRFQRVWTTVDLIPSPRRLHPARLIIRSAGEQVECGAFLTDDERASLASVLGDCVGPMGAAEHQVEDGAGADREGA